MERQVLRDKRGIKIGEIREEGKYLVLRDKSGIKLGYYDPATNVTRDRAGRKIGTGNLLTTLL